jgi:predicted ATPase
MPTASLFAPDRDHLLKPVPLRVSPQMEPNGEGMADALATLSDERKREVLELVRVANPRVTGFEHPRLEVTESVLTEDANDGREYYSKRKLGVGFSLELREGQAVLRGEQASDGTLWAVALGTLLQTSAGTSEHVLLVDDLDRDLHPRAQFDVAKALREIVLSQPATSLVATAHSPFLLNAFEPDEVFVLLRGEGGRVSARPLAEHPEWAKWRGQLETGEFWSWAEESWVDGAA